MIVDIVRPFVSVPLSSSSVQRIYQRKRTTTTTKRWSAQINMAKETIHCWVAINRIHYDSIYVGLRQTNSDPRESVCVQCSRDAAYTPYKDNSERECFVRYEYSSSIYDCLELWTPVILPIGKYPLKIKHKGISFNQMQWQYIDFCHESVNFFSAFELIGMFGLIENFDKSCIYSPQYMSKPQQTTSVAILLKCHHFFHSAIT